MEWRLWLTPAKFREVSLVQVSSWDIYCNLWCCQPHLCTSALLSFTSFTALVCETVVWLSAGLTASCYFSWRYCRLLFGSSCVRFFLKSLSYPILLAFGAGNRPLLKQSFWEPLARCLSLHRRLARLLGRSRIDDISEARAELADQLELRILATTTSPPATDTGDGE